MFNQLNSKITLKKSLGVCKMIQGLIKSKQYLQITTLEKKNAHSFNPPYANKTTKISELVYTKILKK